VFYFEVRLNIRGSRSSSSLVALLSSLAETYKVIRRRDYQIYRDILYKVVLENTRIRP